MDLADVVQGRPLALPVDSAAIISQRALEVLQRHIGFAENTKEQAEPVQHSPLGVLAGQYLCAPGKNEGLAELRGLVVKTAQAIAQVVYLFHVIGPLVVEKGFFEIGVVQFIEVFVHFFKIRPCPLVV